MTISSLAQNPGAAGSASAEASHHDHPHDHGADGHDHADHDHGVPGHAHRHAHGGRVPVRVVPSVIRASLASRLAVAGLVSGLIWAGVLWARPPIGG